MDDLSLRVYLENGSDAMRGGWLELPVVPERLDAFMRGVVGVDDGGGYAVVDHEPGWFGDVLGSDLESFSVSSLNLAARCVAHARDLAVADSVDGDVFLDMLATARSPRTSGSRQGSPRWRRAPGTWPNSGRSIRCRIHGARAIPLRMSCTARMSRTG